MIKQHSIAVALLTTVLNISFLHAQDATATVGNGITVVSHDGKYSMTVTARMANLLEADMDEDFKSTDTDLEVAKARLNFSGHILTPKLTYSLQFGFAAGDTKALPNGNTNIIRDAVIHYKPNAAWTISVGQTKVKANRAHMNSSQLLEFTSRSIVDGQFEQDRDYGVFAEFAPQLKGNFQLALKGSVTSGEGRNYGKTSGSGLSYNGRLELYPFGKMKGKGAFSEGDLEHEEEPRLMLAGAYTFNDRAVRTGGQTGSLLGETRDLQSYYADLVFKYAGWAVAADFMGRSVNHPVVGSAYVFKGTGYNVQASYTWNTKWTLALRNSTLCPHSEIQSLVGYRNQNATTLAIARHIIGHRVKVVADATYYHRSEAASPYNRWQYRLLFELGI